MSRFNSSHAALALSAVALFVALGGTAVAVSGQIGTSQIKNGAVTNNKIANAAVGNHKITNAAVGNHKIANGAVGNQKLANGSVSTSKLQNGAVTSAILAQGAVGAGNLASSSVIASKLAANAVLTGNIADNAVTTSKLANNSVTNSKLGNDAVTTDKVKDGTLTAADIAPNTFVGGTGTLFSGRVVVAPGSIAQVLDLSFGRIVGQCSSTNVPQLGFTPFFNGENIVDWFTTFATTVGIHTTNGLGAGGTFFETNPGLPQSVTWQVGFNNGANHVATAQTTGQFQTGTGCVFMGQGTTTG